MTMGDGTSTGHERFSELSALATSGVLTPRELSELEAHLAECPECREAYGEYAVLSNEGFAHLASRYSAAQETEERWDDTATRRKLLDRVSRVQLQALPQERGQKSPVVSQTLLSHRIANRPLLTAIAACIVLAVSVGAYQYGHRIETAAKEAVASTRASADSQVQKLASEKNASDALLAAQNEKLEQLETEGSQKQNEIETLQAQLATVQQHANDLAASGASSAEQLRSVSRDRDALSAQLEDARHAYDAVQVQLAALRADREKASLQMASLETQVDELSTMNHSLQTKADTTTELLSSDRDIREVMGARNLYIADVFDVDSGSRTRKPFGRVFYTRGKSLIFYAFDLDHQPGIKTARAFQAWGQREAPPGETAQPVSLGILYLDNETNRRWALRCDDPQELAEIDAVFVTVEPNGGSSKPTGKPFLYAMLRKEANHP